MNRRSWLALAALVGFGRIFQTRVLWAEEGLPLAAAQQLLAGHALYREIWFDKPPLLAWFYAGVLKLAGYSGYGLRLLGVLYILAVVTAGYALARRLYGETAARWTAFFLAFFTCFYVPSATTPLAADHAQAIERGLAKVTGRTVELGTRVDPSIIGGVVARIGDTIYDGSVTTQLRRMKKRLTDI